MGSPRWVEKLKDRWQLANAWQVVIVLIVFACTGFTVLFIKRPILYWISGKEETSTMASIVYYIFILPLYNLILLAYGFVFGQFNFFWSFEKRFFRRIFSIFRKRI
jgi:hypothetical protein